MIIICLIEFNPFSAIWFNYSHFSPNFYFRFMETSLPSIVSFRGLRGKILIILLTMSGITCCLLAFTWWQINQLEAEKQLLLDQLQPAQLATRQHDASLHKSILLLQAYLQSGKETYRTSLEESWRDDIIPGEKSLPLMFESFQTQTVSEILETISANTATIHLKQEELIGQIRQELLAQGYYQDEQTEDLKEVQHQLSARIEQEMVPLILETDKQTALLLVQARNYSHSMVQSIEGRLELISTAALVAVIATIIIGSLLAYFLLSQFIRSLHSLKQTIQELNSGNLPVQQTKRERNEIAEISSQLSGLTRHLREVKNLAEKIGEGNFDQSIDVFNNQGALGQALAGMKSSLSRVANEDRQRNWINEGFALFGDIMREHNHSINGLCDATVGKLVKYVGANQGAVFLIEDGDQEIAGSYLNLNACYAYDKKKFLDKKILRGEGLAGQCWQENDSILISDIPAEYVKIHSGLGGSNPTNIFLVPLRAGEESQGIFEIASFSAFESYQREFIEKICENLAAAIATARNTERTMQLLEESQHLTETMLAQEEEMRQNMEELEAIQEEMRRAQQEMITKEQNLNSVINSTSDTIFSIDKEYRITVVNKFLKEKYLKMGIDLKTGTKISDILPKEAWQKWKARYDRALAGEQYSVTEEASGSEGSSFSQTYHNPIRNEKGEITGVSVISRNITETVLNQQEIQRKQSTLNAIINSTDDTYFAIDTDYRILIANKTLKDRFALSGISLDEGELIFDKLPEDKHAYWKELYDRALKGEAFTITQERPVGDKVLFIEVYCHPIMDEENGQIMGASVMSKDISKWKAMLNENKELKQEINKLHSALGQKTTKKEQPTTGGKKINPKKLGKNN
jgi:PAS domain S-box-containing protein